jgi:hypothetical protein
VAAFGWPPEAQAHLNDLYREAAAVIYGRRIYETVVPFWTGIAANGLPEDMPLGETDLEFASIMSPLPKYVVSRGYDPADVTTEVIDSAEVAGIVEAADGPFLTAWAIPPSCTVMRYAVADDFPTQR